MSETAPQPPRPWFSATGLGLGAIGLGVVAIQFVAGPFAPQPDAAMSIGEIGGTMARSAVKSFFGLEPETQVVAVTQAWDIDRVMVTGATILAVVAILLATVGLIRREGRRPVVAALGFGAFALTFQMFASTLLLIIGAVVLIAIISQVGDVLSSFSPF